MLSGLTVLLTRDGGLAEDLSDLGADVRVAEVLRYEAVPVEVDLSGFDWIVFTSRRAVAYSDLPRHCRPKVACVGPATAQAVLDQGGTVDLVPEHHDAAALAGAMIAAGPIAGQRVLFPASEQALSTLEELLESAGAEVVRVTAYRPVPGDRLDPEAAAGADIVVFLAPSAVAAYAQLGGDLTVPAVAIGATTAAALVERGVSPLVAPTADRAGLIAALREFKEQR
jgi:uroporphyrinogen-III synthase